MGFRHPIRNEFEAFAKRLEPLKLRMGYEGAMARDDEDFYEVIDVDEADFNCPTCEGRGTVNPLTAPEGFFCVGVTDCPMCDGTGEI